MRPLSAGSYQARIPGVILGAIVRRPGVHSKGDSTIQAQDR